MSARYVYLQVELVGCAAEPLEVRQTLQTACADLFGESGAALPLDVLTVRHSNTGGRAWCVVRAAARHGARACAALTLAAPAPPRRRRCCDTATPDMSVSRSVSGPGGKDVVLVAARDVLAAPCSVELPEPEPAAGLILPDGSINWGCPCLGGMATGPCAQPFRDAFSCFHYSEAEPKGSDCYEKFSDMQACMARYPELYGRDDDDDDLPPPPADPPGGAAAAAGDSPGGAGAGAGDPPGGPPPPPARP